MCVCVCVCVCVRERERERERERGVHENWHEICSIYTSYLAEKWYKVDHCLCKEILCSPRESLMVNDMNLYRYCIKLISNKVVRIIIDSS